MFYVVLIGIGVAVVGLIYSIEVLKCEGPTLLTG